MLLGGLLDGEIHGQWKNLLGLHKRQKVNPSTACFSVFLALCRWPEGREDDCLLVFLAPLETWIWIGEGKKKKEAKEVVILDTLSMNFSLPS